jgi:transcriptional regulator with XRE-family HTH domain
LIILIQEVYAGGNVVVNAKRIVISYKRMNLTPGVADIYEKIGERIRDFRGSVGGRGISQEDLAHAVGTTANTVSRWETATYKPAISDLEKLARYFGVPITAFFPDVGPRSRTAALLSATAGLDDADLDEVRLYALFRRSRRRVKRTK